MRSFAVLAIAASAAIPVFVAAAPMSAEGVDGSPTFVKDVLDVSHSNSDNQLHSRDEANYPFGDGGPIFERGSNSSNNNPPYSRDADGIPAVEVGSKPGPGDIGHKIRQGGSCRTCEFDHEEPNTLD